MKITMNLGEYISTNRKKLRLTQEELSEILNVSKSAVSKWETSNGIPDRANLDKLAEVFNVTVSELYRIIKGNSASEPDSRIDITADILEVLRSRGYTILPPDDEASSKKN